jgi:hypothetical protein
VELLQVVKQLLLDFGSSSSTSVSSDGQSCLSNVHCRLVEMHQVAKQLLLDFSSSSSAFSDGQSCLSNVHCRLVEMHQVAKQLLLNFGHISSLTSPIMVDFRQRIMNICFR